MGILIEVKQFSLSHPASLPINVCQSWNSKLFIPVNEMLTHYINEGRHSSSSIQASKSFLFNLETMIYKFIHD